MKIRSSRPINKAIHCGLQDCGCRRNNFIWYSHKLKAVYYETPKAACTSIKKALQIEPSKDAVVRAYLLQTNGAQLKNGFPERICRKEIKRMLSEQKRRIELGWPCGVTLGMYEFSMYFGSFYESLEEFQSYYKFGFVRDPVKRTVSNYQMFFGGSDIRFKQMKSLFGPKADGMSFDSFVKNMRDVKNHHWDPYVNYIPDSLKLDRLGKLESLSTDWGDIAAALGIDKSLPWDNKSDKNKFHFSDAAEELIRECYKKDCERFGY